MRTTIRSLAAAALLATAAPALATSVTFPTPDGGFCTVNPGSSRSSVVCDYQLDGPPPPRGRVLRARVLMYLGQRGQAQCAVTDVYDPAIPTIRDGRILSTETRCF